jgi:hypothetical protein
LDAFLDKAVAAGELSAAESAAVANCLTARSGSPAMPWYLHGIVAIGAWLAAIFLTAFCLAAFGELLWKSSGGAIVTGLLVIAAVTIARRAAASVFWAQVCLAFSVAGHALVFIGISNLTAHELPAITAAACVLAGILYVPFRDPLHRFLSTLTALVFTTLWIHDGQLPPLAHASVMLHVLIVAFAFVRVGTPARFRPLGYAAAFSLLHLVSPLAGVWRTDVVASHSWPAKVLLGLSLIALSIWAAGAVRDRQSQPVQLAAIAGLAALAACTSPGVLVALGLLLLGFSLQDRPLLALGLVALPVFLFEFYYDLEMTLLHKSGLLVGSGVLLLAARAVVVRFPATNA